MFNITSCWLFFNFSNICAAAVTQVVECRSVVHDASSSLDGYC